LSKIRRRRVCAWNFEILVFRQYMPSFVDLFP
jgi:hypothetical protein